METANLGVVVGATADHDDSTSKDRFVLVHIIVQNKAAYPFLSVWNSP
jgi:hypothetical protein